MLRGSWMCVQTLSDILLFVAALDDLSWCLRPTASMRTSLPVNCPDLSLWQMFIDLPPSYSMTTSIHTFSIFLSSILHHHHHHPLSFSVFSLPLALLLPLLLLQPTVWVSSGVQSTVLHWSVKSDLVWLCFCPLPERLASPLSDTAEGIWGGELSQSQPLCWVNSDVVVV